MAPSTQLTNHSDAHYQKPDLWAGTKQPGIQNRLHIPLWFEQAAKFITVGAFNTLLDAVLYFTLTRWLGFAALPVLAKGISYGIGILNSYYWNKSWTFKAEGRTHWAMLAVFIVSNLAALGINMAFMYLAIRSLVLPETLAWLLATSVAFAWNFLLTKFVVFRGW